MKNSAIIFDLDGTLWEVIDSTLNSANEICRKNGLNELDKETICKGFGTNREESAKLYFPNLPLEESTILIDEISKLNIDNLMKNGGNIYAYLKETLITLNLEYRLFIVSNTTKMQYIEAFLKCSDTKELFDDCIAAGFFKLTKADAIKKVIEDNNISKAVYVGDTIKDQEAAQNANVLFIHAKYGFGDDLNAKYNINSIIELPKIIKKLL